MTERTIHVQLAELQNYFDGRVMTCKCGSTPTHCMDIMHSQGVAKLTIYCHYCDLSLNHRIPLSTLMYAICPKIFIDDFVNKWNEGYSKA